MSTSFVLTDTTTPEVVHSADDPRTPTHRTLLTALHDTPTAELPDD